MTFEVLTYNIREGGKDRLPIIADVLRCRRPDAVALLEANGRSNALTLAREMEMDLAFGTANNEYHVAWLSRRAILGSRNHRLGSLSKTLLEIEVTWEGAPLRLFATHLASRHDTQTPEAEVTAILGVLRRSSDERHLLVGDLNSLGPGDPVGTPPNGVEPREDTKEGAPRRTIQRILDAGYADCWRTLHPEAPGYSYPSSSPWLRLDYAFASPDMASRLRACEVVSGEEAIRGSDHLPVLAVFR